MSQLKRTLITVSIAAIFAVGLSACDNSGSQAKKPNPSAKKLNQGHQLNSKPNTHNRKLGGQSGGM